MWFSFSAPMFVTVRKVKLVLRAPSARVETWTASSSSAPFLWEAPGHIHLLRKNPRSRSLVVGAAGELVLAQLDVPHLAVLDGLSEGLAHGPLAAHGLELLEIPDEADEGVRAEFEDRRLDLLPHRVFRLRDLVVDDEVKGAERREGYIARRPCGLCGG